MSCTFFFCLISDAKSCRSLLRANKFAQQCGFLFLENSRASTPKIALNKTEEDTHLQTECIQFIYRLGMDSLFLRFDQTVLFKITSLISVAVLLLNLGSTIATFPSSSSSSSSSSCHRHFTVLTSSVRTLYCW